MLYIILFTDLISVLQIKYPGPGKWFHIIAGLSKSPTKMVSYIGYIHKLYQTSNKIASNTSIDWLKTISNKCRPLNQRMTPNSKKKSWAECLYLYPHHIDVFRCALPSPSPSNQQMGVSALKCVLKLQWTNEFSSEPWHNWGELQNPTLMLNNILKVCIEL